MPHAATGRLSSGVHPAFSRILSHVLAASFLVGGCSVEPETASTVDARELSDSSADGTSRAPDSTQWELDGPVSQGKSHPKCPQKCWGEMYGYCISPTEVCSCGGSPGSETTSYTLCKGDRVCFDGAWGEACTLSALAPHDDKQQLGVTGLCAGVTPTACTSQPVGDWVSVSQCPGAMAPGQPPCAAPSAEFDECQGEDNESACWWSRNDHLKMKADGSMSLTSVDSLKGRWVLSAACIAKVRPVQMYAKSCGDRQHEPTFWLSQIWLT